MRKTKIEPIYHMTFPKLFGLGERCITLIDRDALILVNYGIDTIAYDEIVDLVRQVRQFPPDGVLIADAKTAREERDACKESVKESIRSIMARAEEKYGLKSASYRKFGTKGMSSMSNSRLASCAKMVAQMAQVCLPDLLEKGLTQQMIDDLIALNTSFDSKVMATLASEKLRDEATENRIVLGNTLYKKITEVFKYGKTYWASRNAAKHKDYVIYRSKKSKTDEEEEQ